MKKNPITTETYVLLILFLGGFLLFSLEMGVANFLNTMINTSFFLLTEVAFWIMGVAVLTGAMAGIFAEFGIVALLNIVFGPVVRLIYKLPGVAGIGAISAYLSDNPAVISLYKEKEFRKQFKGYQIPVLVNLGTSFGMGLVIAIFFISLNNEYASLGNFFVATGVGVIASIIGSIVSVRLLTHFSKKHFSIPSNDNPIKRIEGDEFLRDAREGTFVNRFLESALDGGKNGVDIGLQIIPGILIISTFIIMFTNGQPVDSITGNLLPYSGAAKEGIGYLPLIGEHLMFIFRPLFGFTSPEAIAFPLISLGSAGAAIGIVPEFIENGYVTIKDIAVFTAIGTTWSGYLSTHVGMMDAVKSRGLTTQAIVSHTIGGLVSGITANYLFILVLFLFELLNISI
jgi:hypothetical protein